MTATTLRLLIVGAHPDDAEFHAGGLATRYRRLGHVVKMISLTDGGAGHHRSIGPELVARRRLEAQAAAAVIGASSEVWDQPDGALEPSLALRWRVIAELRRFAPDLVLTHRTNDYHPDHRATGQVICDASYLVTVPAVVPEVPILARPPVVAYLTDRFTKPTPLAPDVVLDVGDEWPTAARMLACHVSQVFEWLPYNRGLSEQVPADEAGRRAWLTAWYQQRLRDTATRFREQLIAQYGPRHGGQVAFAEAYEISEYAAPLDAAAAERLFPRGTLPG